MPGKRNYPAVGARFSRNMKTKLRFSNERGGAQEVIRRAHLLYEVHTGPDGPLEWDDLVRMINSDWQGQAPRPPEEERTNW